MRHYLVFVSRMPLIVLRALHLIQLEVYCIIANHVNRQFISQVRYDWNCLFEHMPLNNPWESLFRLKFLCKSVGWWCFVAHVPQVFSLEKQVELLLPFVNREVSRGKQTRQARSSFSLLVLMWFPPGVRFIFTVARRENLGHVQFTRIIVYTEKLRE